MGSDLVTVESVESTAMTVESVKAQVDLIQSVMRGVMKKDEHFGTIPGCGDKPTLLKPGAEKLGLTFRLAPHYTVERNDLPSAHREYQVTCRLIHIPTGDVIGEGVGGGSTMESKYRYRSENTGKEVPKEYWKTRDPEIIGGRQFSTKKQGKVWFIMHRVEHDNPADYYNTVLKMTKKRAHVDAILTATAASDIFTQDVEDMVKASEPKPARRSSPRKKSAPRKPPPEQEDPPAQREGGGLDGYDPSTDDRPITENQRRKLYGMLKSLGASERDMKDVVRLFTGKESSTELTRAEIDRLYKLIDSLPTYDDLDGWIRHEEAKALG
jgi:hypothetical protein